MSHVKPQLGHSRIDLMASPSNNRDQEIIAMAAPNFRSGDVTRAFYVLVGVEGMNNPNTSIFAGLGWDTKTCRDLVLNDHTLKQAVCDCFEQESLDPLRVYS
jgi:hypothetical protein